MSRAPARAATDADVYAAAMARWDNEGGSLGFAKVPKREKDEVLAAFAAQRRSHRRA
jgi:hypothetical protein